MFFADSNGTFLVVRLFRLTSWSLLLIILVLTGALVRNFSSEEDTNGFDLTFRTNNRSKSAVVCLDELELLLVLVHGTL